MHEETVTKNTKGVLEALNKTDFIKNFYLAGGTSLAIYLGHRISVDLDWFAESFNYTPIFRKKLADLGKLEIDDETEKTFNGSLNGVKISFFEYPYLLFAPKTKYSDNIYLAGIPDIAAMKLDAIGSRGSRKDFVDIYFLLKQYSMEKLLGFVRKKFADIEYNQAHLLKALIYFKDAENTEMPKMLHLVKWEEIKKEITEKVKKYINES